ncbi:transferase [Rhodococcus sp. BP-252]|uniref:class I SAM-dependent methyltransferase n=1 Tax=unclassified Rhodococcus (in: high G+C Gram-positive bacteria) TaxID=192944 RepID=UPI001430603A|nr:MULTISPECIES: class I SAM-dependent methyltransferase [unclassified Rhodococcus (in: high G+C Gram-positive bacteria)]MBY6412228.1 transferase [Rhodococcus sp. BP-320]MBY6416808.1 transferase [Rhodococcus sp. BP-321]MBY6421654.1 transferase [Rhodococcus sp. BP-324]MBY6426920.1 transferase [Rhodococcus sp. BP-323]MBY6432086.1 transferase [Rhodococcus sp. BP-322]
MTGRRCRGCGSDQLDIVLDLHSVPAADQFPQNASAGSDDARHPLAMVLCGRCALAQLADDDTVADEPRGIEPQALTDQAAEAVAVVAGSGWLRGSTVREFGSPHGGTWLPLLSDRGVDEVAPGQRADVVLDCFGIMHEPDQADAFAVRAASLAEDGVLLIQFHTLSAIVREGQWNALRHGHFAYYSLTSLTHLLAGVGLVARSAWTFELYGGTILLAATRTGVPDASVREILDVERAAGIDDAETVGALHSAAETDRTMLHDSLVELKSAGKVVFAYGAASRAVALFAMAGLTRSLLAGVADASPSKQGRRMPGTDIPIISPAELVAAQPDVVLLTLPDLLGELDASIPELRGRWWLHGTDIREGTR